MAASLIICNWKMYFSHNQAVAWYTTHHKELENLISATPHRMIICPSYDAIAPIAKLRNNENNAISIGAQDCSAFSQGPYTREVSAQSLKEIGATYTIVGHSDTRKNLKSISEVVALKAKQAFEHNLTPIVCIGETRENYTAGVTLNIIEEQVRPVLKLCQEYDKEFAIAYEPVWSIGTNVIPDRTHLVRVYDYIKRKCTRLGIQRIPLLLYGGSVDEIVISKLKAIPEIEGFLIGKASTDFQKLKKIVELI